MKVLRLSGIAAAICFLFIIGVLNSHAGSINVSLIINWTGKN